MTDIQSKEIFSRLLDENVAPECMGIGTNGETRWLLKDADGVIEQFGILNDELHGGYRIFTPDGDEVEGTFNHDKKEGVWKCYTHRKLDEYMVYKNDLLAKEETDKMNALLLNKQDAKLEAKKSKIDTIRDEVILSHPLRMMKESQGRRNSILDMNMD